MNSITEKPLIQNRDIFAQVFHKLEFASELIEAFTGNKLVDPEVLETEETGYEALENPDAFDVYVRDGNDLYGVRMQSDHCDTVILKVKDDADMLYEAGPSESGGEAWAIYFCTEDPFGHGDVIYNLTPGMRDGNDVVFNEHEHIKVVNLASAKV